MRLADYRKLRCLSREAAARELQTTATTIYRWESGRCVPCPASIVRIAAWSCEAVTANDLIPKSTEHMK